MYIAYQTGQTPGYNPNGQLCHDSSCSSFPVLYGLVSYRNKSPPIQIHPSLIQYNAKPRVKPYLKFCTMVTLTLSQGYTHTIKHRSAKPFLHIGKRQLFIQCTDQTWLKILLLHNTDNNLFSWHQCVLLIVIKYSWFFDQMEDSNNSTIESWS